VIRAHNKHKVIATSVASTQSLSLQQKKVNGIMEEYRDIFCSPTGVPTYFQFKHPIDLTLEKPLPNGPVYHCSLMENYEIMHHIQELLQKGHIRPSQILLTVHVGILPYCMALSQVTKGGSRAKLLIKVGCH
jgi:hypothetical protein